MRNTSRQALAAFQAPQPTAAAPPRLQVNCGLIGMGTVGAAVMEFFAKGPLELRLAQQGIGGQPSVPIHLWSASRRTLPAAALEARIRKILGRAGERGAARFYCDASSADAAGALNPNGEAASQRPAVPAWRRVVEDPAVDIVIEVTGSPVAEALIEEALWRGKCVVTANKRVMSRSGYELVRLAESRGTVLAYEAAVGGGMPIVQTIGTSIGGKITAMMGILNGTTNFILSEMWEGAEKAASPKDAAGLYPKALAAAIQKGLAEADPSDDVLGEDPRSKLIILAGLAFGVRLRPADVYLRGIARKGKLTAESIFHASDLAALRALGHVPKLLAGAQRHREGGRERIVGWVQPVAVPAAHPLAGAKGSANACLLQVESPIPGGEGARAFEVLVRGPGAGGPETASSVISDIQFCARQLVVAGRVGHQGAPRDSAVYNYGSAAFSHAQDYLGAPSLCLSRDLIAPFLLRFVCSGPARNNAVSARALEALRGAGVQARTLPSPGAGQEYLYLMTSPASIAAIEGALEKVLAAARASELSMDVLYLPLLDGAAWDTAAERAG